MGQKERVTQWQNKVTSKNSKHTAMISPPKSIALYFALVKLSCCPVPPNQDAKYVM